MADHAFGQAGRFTKGAPRREMVQNEVFELVEIIGRLDKALGDSQVGAEVEDDLKRNGLVQAVARQAPGIVEITHGVESKVVEIDPVRLGLGAAQQAGNQESFLPVQVRKRDFVIIEVHINISPFHGSASQTSIPSASAPVSVILYQQCDHQSRISLSFSS